MIPALMANGQQLIKNPVLGTKNQKTNCGHSGLDPWFDVPFDRLVVLSNVEGLTTLSKVEGESSFIYGVQLLDAGSGLSST